jgi:hypothetical protein
MTDKIIEKALLEYVDLYGKSESNEIMDRTKNSKLFGNNLEIACQNKIVFSGDSINQIVASSHWKFVLGPKRKIYFASLLFLVTTYKKFEHLNIPHRRGIFY